MEALDQDVVVDSIQFSSVQFGFIYIAPFIIELSFYIYVHTHVHTQMHSYRSTCIQLCS